MKPSHKNRLGEISLQLGVDIVSLDHMKTIVDYWRQYAENLIREGEASESKGTVRTGISIRTDVEHFEAWIGFGSDRALSYQNVAGLKGVTSTTVIQRIRKLLRRMRHPAHRSVLYPGQTQTSVELEVSEDETATPFGVTGSSKFQDLSLSYIHDVVNVGAIWGVKGADGQACAMVPVELLRLLTDGDVDQEQADKLRVAVHRMLQRLDS